MARVADEAVAFEPNPARPDVFISYSRHDREFVEGRLVAGLAEQQLDVWVDLEDIPPASDWHERVFAGIDTAKAFVAVLSPDYLASEICGEELDRGLAGNKRLIPILRRDVTGVDVRAELERPNWIYFRDDDDSEQAARELIEALTTDLEWRDMHARIASRAQEWERARHDSSFLLRGDDLSSAETWLAGQATHEEKPTELQIEYLVTSRQAATRRQRSLLGAAIVALAIISGLGVVALLQRNEARTQQAHAEAETRVARAQTRLALSRQLAVDSGEALRRRRPDLALLLGAQATSFNPSREARRALWNGLDQVPQLRLLLRDRIEPEGFIDDDRLLLRSGGTWDLRAREKTEGNGRRRILASGLDGSFLAADHSGRFYVLRAPHGVENVGRLIGASTKGPAAIGEGGKVLAVAAHGQRDVVLVDRRRARKRTLPIPHPFAPPSIGAVALTRDARRLVVVGSERPLVFDTRSGARIRTLRCVDAGDAVDVAASPVDPNTVAIATNSHVSRCNVATGGQIGDSFEGRPNLLAATFSSNGRVIAAAGVHGVVFWRVATGEELPGSWSLDEPMGRVVAARGSLRFASGGGWFGAPDLAVWDLAGGNRLMQRISAPISVTSVAFSTKGSRFAAGGPRGVAVWNALGRPSPRVYANELVVDSKPVFSPDGRTLAVSAKDGLRILRADTAKADGPAMRYIGLSAEESPPAAAFSPDGGRVVAGYERDLLVWDLQTHTHGPPLWYSPVGTLPQVSAVVYSPGGILAAAGGHGLAFWPGNRLFGRPSPVDASSRYVDLAFNDRGTRFVASAGPRLVLFDAASRKHVVTSVALPADIVDVAFGPDGLTVAGAGPGGATLWSGSGLRLIGTASLHRAAEGTGVAFSPDGRRLAFADGSRSVGVFDASVASWRREACETVNRTLTRAEWRKYVGAAAPYAPVCRR